MIHDQNKSRGDRSRFWGLTRENPQVDNVDRYVEQLAEPLQEKYSVRGYSAEYFSAMRASGREAGHEYEGFFYIDVTNPSDFNPTQGDRYTVSFFVDEWAIWGTGRSI